MFKRVIFAILVCVCFALPVLADDYEDIYIGEVPETVDEPAPEDIYPTPEPVPVALDYEALASVLADAMATPEPTEMPEETADQEAAPEPTPQIIIIQQTPETASLPESTAAPTLWDKPFDEYTPTEGLLLTIFVLLCFMFLLIWYKG